MDTVHRRFAVMDQGCPNDQLKEGSGKYNFSIYLTMKQQITGKHHWDDGANSSPLLRAFICIKSSEFIDHSFEDELLGHIHNIWEVF